MPIHADQKNKERRIQSLLQQCQRQFTHPQQQRQPHAVAASLGRALAQACHETITNDDQTNLLETLARTDLHPSIAHAFFENLGTQTAFLATGIVALEPSTCFHSCARAYAKSIVDHRHPRDHALQLLNTYQRLEQPSSRDVLVREMIPRFAENTTRMPAVLSPLLAVTFLSLSETSHEQSCFLQQLWRVLWSVWAGQSLGQKIQILEWLTRGLLVILMAQDNHYQIDLMQSWFTELVLLAQASVPRDEVDDDNREILPLVQWSDALLCEIVPLLRDKANPSRGRSALCSSIWKPIYDGLVDWLALLRDYPDNARVPLDPFSVLQWSTHLLSVHSVEERKALMNLLFHWTTPRLTVSLPFVRSLLEGLSCVWIHDPECQSLALQLKQELLVTNSMDDTMESTIPSSSIGARLLEGDNALLGRIILSSPPFTDATKLSSELQITLLLVAVSQLSVLSTQRDWYAFLERLIQAYPHLGIIFLPVHLQLVQNAAQACDGHDLLRHLEFMAGPLVIDPHCAQQVWTFFGSQWVEDGGSMDLRIAILRLYPSICRTNKRMYRRVIDSLGSYLREKDPEIRLAVAATICDLAQDDCIRDVSDVIGWIQQLLMEDGKSPVYALLKHYAIMSLHFLTLHGELEFPLVIKVLNKKLCNITDHDKVIELSVPVLEALCLLLGDGETDDDESEAEANDAVGLQVRQSIDTLLYLGDALPKNNKALQENERRTTGVETCLFHIFESLNRYSLKTLEVEEEDVKRAAAASEETEENSNKIGSNRYLQLQELVLDGMESLNPQNKDNSTVQPVIELARRLMSFEEDVLGAGFWQKRSSPRKGGRASRDQLRREQALRAALPSASLLASLSNPPSSNARAIAVLWASDGTRLTILRDHADASIESTDPLLLLFAVKGFLRISGLCLRTTSNSPSSLLKEIRDWNEVFVSPDAMYLCLASLAVSLSEGALSDEQLRSEIGVVTEEVLVSFQANQFRDESIGKICLGLCGIVYIHLGEFQKAVEMLDALEHSVRGYGGQQDFGAYLGVSIIAQTVEIVSKREQPSLSGDAMSKITSKAASFIVEELLSCFEDGGDATRSLLACLKTGKATPDLVLSLERLGSNSLSLLMTKNVVARSLLISSSICLPSLAVSEGSLLLGAFRLVESFEWTGGKGIALASILRHCDAYQLIAKTELELIHNEYASILQRRIDRGDIDIGAGGLDDIFYAVNGTSTAAMPQFVRRLLVGNREVFGDDGCATSLIACVLSICSVPALGVTSSTGMPRIHPKSSGADVEDITKIVLAAAKRGDGSKYSSMGTVLLGMLSSAQTEIFLEETSSNFNSNSKFPDKKAVDPSSVGIEFLSRPHLGTLSEGVFTLLERCYLVARAKECIGLRSCLAALESISLPGEFAKGVILKHLQTLRWGGEAGVSLLCSQIEGRRSVLQDGREFVDLALQISVSSPDEWLSAFAEKSAREVYIKDLHKIFPKISDAALGKSIRNLWKLCNDPGAGSRAMAILFLNSMERLLVGSALSLKAKQNIYDILCSECFATVIADSFNEASIETEGPDSLLTSFISCIQLLPLAVLESSTFISLTAKNDKDSMLQDSFRAYLILKLLRGHGSIPAPNKQAILKQYQCWLIQSLASVDTFQSMETDCLRRLHPMFATLTADQSIESKHEIVLCVMDSMLLASAWTLSASLELLGMLVATWCYDLEESSASLRGLLQINNPGMEKLTSCDRTIVYEGLVRDFPKNLSRLVTHGNRAQFLNILHRLQLGSDGIAPEALSRTILFALFSCQGALGKDSSSVHEAAKFMM